MIDVIEINRRTDSIFQKKSYTVTNEIVLKNPTKNGYVFEYWYDSNNEELVNGTIVKGSAGDVVLYAKWAPMKFTLSYDSNGGTGEMASKEADMGTTFTLAPVTFTNGTYKFAGWSRTKGGTPEFSNGAIYTMGASDVTLYAVWVNTEYTIQWVLNGGQNNPDNPTGYSSNVGTTMFFDPLNRTGYTFGGWYTDSECKTEPIKSIEPGNRTNYVIYAKWTANQYKVTFKPNNGQANIETWVTYDSPYGYVPNVTLKGNTFRGWYYNDSVGIASTSIVNVAQNHVIEAKWQVNTYTISFNANGGTGNTNSKNIVFGTTYGTLPSVSRPGYEFLGWFDDNGIKINTYTIMNTDKNHILKAGWKALKCYINLGGDATGYYVEYSDGYDKPRATFGLPTPSKAGHTFGGWYLNDYYGPRIFSDTMIDYYQEEYKLVAEWYVNWYTVTITSEGEKGGYITDSYGNVISSGTSYAYGTWVQFNVHYNGDENNWWSIGGTTQSEGSVGWTIYDNVTIVVHSDKSCVASGTMITLADGTQKKIEDVKEDDILLVFNHETGKYEAAPILFIEADGWQEYNIINLEFSDGTKSRIIAEHAFFDVTLNKYVYIGNSSYHKYVGHEFAIMDEQMNMTTVTLEKAYKTYEYVGCYSLITSYHANYFVDGLLSIPGGINGIFNFFEYGENLAYDLEQMEKDIEKYGLYTYEDFAEYVPYEVYEYMFPAKYYKIAVGKGLITFEGILELIEHYLVAHGYA
ncbi:MAG: InlB B-repeat-containing protein [Clostridia bacterium]|nr:InlB B-repeat-containing protein [Clostridia bacterium]